MLVTGGGVRVATIQNQHFGKCLHCIDHDVKNFSLLFIFSFVTLLLLSYLIPNLSKQLQKNHIIFSRLNYIISY